MGKNFRETKQRLAIRRVLAEKGQPMSPKAIWEAARVHSKSLGIATVYRFLRIMVEERQVEQVDLPGLRTCYMLPGTPHEHFLICERSEEVRRLPQVQLEIPPESLPPGFRVTRFEVIVFGEFAPEDGSDGSPVGLSVAKKGLRLEGGLDGATRSEGLSGQEAYFGEDSSQVGGQLWAAESQAGYGDISEVPEASGD